MEVETILKWRRVGLVKVQRNLPIPCVLSRMMPARISASSWRTLTAAVSRHTTSFLTLRLAAEVKTKQIVVQKAPLIHILLFFSMFMM